jgi:hypothetical protein
MHDLLAGARPYSFSSVCLFLVLVLVLVLRGFMRIMYFGS